jgi:hypothetical protein
MGSMLHQLAKCQNESHFRRFAFLSHRITEGIDNQSSYLSGVEDSGAEDSDSETI